MEQRMLCLAQHRNWGIHTHCRNGFCAILRHGQNACLQFLIGIAKGLLHSLPFLVGKFGNSLIGDLQIL